MFDDFTISDYQEAVFSGKLPSRIIFPFKRWKHSPYYNKSYTLKVVEDISADTDYEILREVCPDKIDYLPPFVIRGIISDYMDLLTKWFKGIVLVRDIADTSYSRTQWSGFKFTMGGRFSNTLNASQIIWIYLNELQDKSQDNIHTSNMFDYLSMMVNPEMYKKLQDIKEGSKENESFNEMHDALRLGNLSQFDDIVKGAQ